jgi:hypothetical protein
MALKMKYTRQIAFHADDYAACIDNGISTSITVDGNTYGDAYIKVETVNSSKSEAKADVKVYDDYACGKLISDKTYVFLPSIEDDAPNIIKQAYLYLKALPEYAEAIDC